MRHWLSRSRSTASAPIRGRDKRSFIIGWLSILAVGAAMFAIITLPLSHSKYDLQVAGQSIQTVATHSQI